MADVILIQPKIEEKLSLYQHPISRIKDFYGNKSFPLGLLHISRYLVSEYKVKIIDQRIDKNWKKHLLKELNQNPICVGLTSMTGPQIRYALEISKFIKQNSNVPVIWGGTHPTLEPYTTIKNKYVDLVVKGEGEITFFELVKALEKNRSLRGIKGVVFKDKGAIRSNQDRHFLELDNLPEIPYELINFKRYLIRFSKTIDLETSRGCVHKCGFCYNSCIKQHYRFLKAEKLFEQIRYLNEKFNVKRFFFSDDNSFVNYKRSQLFMEMVIKEKMDISWFGGGVDINSLSRYKIDLLEKSGCDGILVGVESGSQRILDFINKNIKFQQLKDLNEKFSNSNIYLYYGFMIGFPNETKEDSIKTINLMFNLLEKNKNIYVSLSIYTPYPSNKLYFYSVKKGFKPPQSLIEWSNLCWNLVNTPWIKKDMKKILPYMFYINDIRIFPKIIRNPILNSFHKKMLNILKESQKKCQN